MLRAELSAPLLAGIATLFLLLTLSACTDVATPTPTPTVTPWRTPTPLPVYDVEEARAELAAAKALWESKGSDHYTIENDAFLNLSIVPIRLTVRNGVIESATLLEGRDSGMPVPPEQMRRVLTIDGLFDKIEEALSGSPAWNMSAEYDAELGYPREFGASYSDTPDDYFTASFCCYKPLAHPLPTVAPATSTLWLDTEGRHAGVLDLFSSGDAMSSVGPAATVEEVLERGLRLAGASPAHLAFRGTAVANSARCDWRGIARTAGQRADAIRYWLKLDADDEIPNAAYLEGLFTITLDTLDPNFRETAKSNFLAIARGGLSEEYLFLSCFADYSVSEYLLGTGPASLSVAYDRRGEARSYGLYLREHAAGAFGPATSTPLMSEGEYQASLDRTVSEAESTLADILEGREAVVFLAPMGAHNAIAVEAWQAVAQWDVQRAEDGTLYAVRYGAHEGDPEHTHTLANLESRVTAATTATSTTATSTATSTTATSTAATTTRIASVSGLTQYYHSIGAYSDITPDDNATTTFTPAQTPPGYAPAPAGLSASGSGEDTANLSWYVVSGASGYQIQHRQTGEGRWTTAEESATTTTRSVTGLWCGRTHEFRVGAHGDGTTYNARAGFWSPTATTTLDACTLHPPRFTADSYSFVVGVGSSPGSPVGTVSAIDVNEDPVAHSITAGSGAGKFTIDAVTGEITVAASLGPTVGIIYELTVSAADGVSGTDSATVRVTTVCLGVTATCNHRPAFSTSPYAFSVAEDATTSTVVGTVSASDSDGDTVTYSIASGNGDGVFSINSDTGEVIVAGALDYESVSSYTLTVEARDGKENSTAQATVEISVTNVPEGTPPASLGLSVLLSDDTFTIWWRPVSGADRYKVQHRTGGTNGEWASLAAVTSTDQAFSPDGGPSCESTYDFRVKARGDGQTYIAGWGAPSGVVSHTTGACNRPPAFGTSPYAFSVAENARTNTTVGTVSAIDPDGNTVTYSIASGNGDEVFSIYSDTGKVIVAGALDYESVSSYTLTVEARDSRGGTAAATVEISVTNVAEESPPPPRTVTANSTHVSITPSPEARDDSPAAGSTSCGGRRWRGERAPIAHEGDTGNSKTVNDIDAAGAGTVSGFANLKTPAQP